MLNLVGLRSRWSMVQKWIPCLNNGLLSANEYYAIDDYIVVFQSHFNKGSLVDASKGSRDPS